VKARRRRPRAEREAQGVREKITRPWVEETSKRWLGREL